MGNDKKFLDGNLDPATTSDNITLQLKGSDLSTPGSIEKSVGSFSVSFVEDGKSELVSYPLNTNVDSQVKNAISATELLELVNKALDKNSGAEHDFSALGDLTVEAANKFTGNYCRKKPRQI